MLNITRAWPAKNASSVWGESRIQGFSSSVKLVEFREVGRAYFWLDFLFLFHLRKKIKEINYFKNSQFT
jgi:hypothetical protein